MPQIAIPRFIAPIYTSPRRSRKPEGQDPRLETNRQSEIPLAFCPLNFLTLRFPKELDCDGERHLSTSHPKIMVAESQRVELMSLARSLAHLEDLGEGPNDAVRNTLKRIVPEFCQEAGEFLSRRAA